LATVSVRKFGVIESNTKVTIRFEISNIRTALLITLLLLVMATGIICFVCSQFKAICRIYFRNR